MNEPPPLAPDARRALAERRVGLVRRICQSRGAADALLSTRRNFAWITAGGDAHVESASDVAAAHIRITAHAWSVVTTVIEERRLRDEELGDLGVTVEALPWDVELPGAALRDDDLERQLRIMRAALEPAEHERMRWLGARAERAVAEVAEATKPGETEAVIAAALARQLARDAIRAPVVLVGADDRIARYRHPVPTAKRLARTLMLVVVAERWGLHVALTRMVTFGAAPPDLALRYAAARDIEQAMHAATRPRRTLADVLGDATAAYRRAGFADEWRLHHQGGLIAYRPREVIATPNALVPIAPGMSFAWNPSITGAKVEDTFILRDDGTHEVVTRAGGWPVDAGGAPAILER